MSKRKLVATVETSFQPLKIYRDADYAEWRVVDPNGGPDAYYCTDDRTDAFSTAEALAQSYRSIPGWGEY